MNRWIAARTENRFRQWTALLMLALALFALGSRPARSDTHKKKSQRVIDFDDEVVEGVNQRPLDSLSQISERGKKKHRPHLYRKRGGFRTELKQTIHELRYVQ